MVGNIPSNSVKKNKIFVYSHKTMPYSRVTEKRIPYQPVWL